MRRVAVNRLRCVDSGACFRHSAHTSIEAAEQGPHPRAGPRRPPSHARRNTTYANRRERPIRAGGSLSQESRSHGYFYPCRWRCPEHQRRIREAWTRAPLLHSGSRWRTRTCTRALAPAHRAGVARRRLDRDCLSLCAVRQHPGIDIAPQRDQEFAREGDDADFAQPSSSAPKSALIPHGQRTRGLIVEPAPR
jgi:hypothetical protein